MPAIPTQKTRIVTAASLFDGHDAAINIMRRILQSKGAEIIHLGHNRSVREIVECAIEEDAHGIAITSYQGGHVEFFRYMKDMLEEAGCGHIKIFGGGGGTILPSEMEELHRYGITRIYSPDDGRSMGLEGMIEDVIAKCRAGIEQSVNDPGNSGVDRTANDAANSGVDRTANDAGSTGYWNAPENWNGMLPLGEKKDIRRVARAITMAEEGITDNAQLLSDTANTIKETQPGQKNNANSRTPVIGITGTGGAGKSSVTDEIVLRLLRHSDTLTLAVISVDPSKKKTGGALLGDRIRMNAIANPRVYMRSLATRDDNTALSAHVKEAIDVCRKAGYDLVILESAGVGQSDTSVLEFCDLSIYVMTPEYGAASQLEKINMLDYADIVVINKFDKAGAKDAMHDVRKQYKRNHGLWTAKEDELPVFGTIAAQFNDTGINALFLNMLSRLGEKTGFEYHFVEVRDAEPPGEPATIIPARRVRYLSEIADNNRNYDKWVNEQAAIASDLYKLTGTLEILTREAHASAAAPVTPAPPSVEQRHAIDEQINKKQRNRINEQNNEKQRHAIDEQINEKVNELLSQLDPRCRSMLDGWEELKQKYAAEYLEYQVRERVIRQPLTATSLAGTKVSRVLLPKYKDWGDILRWRLQENVPGAFPYTAGVFELKREGEDPTRMFAGEGGPERTNKRFHYVSAGQPAVRLSTAFDSVTLYGEDPDERPDIFGKIGNAGVSIATADDAKKLYSGFDLCSSNTSVSMTINGPAPMILAFFLNAAVDQECEKYIEKHGLWDMVEKKSAAKYGNMPRPYYYNPSAPEGHPVKTRDNARVLGLGLLGLSGDEVLEPPVYATLKARALSQVRGTVQADILKEDQAQNTCIFSTEFALKLMGDVQEYFIGNSVRNFYSVSISGYHIAEAGANPITQLAFTLANGFTYLEYYLARGMKIDDFAPNLSFFFSNGMDPEYSVIGRVARRIWAKAVKQMYSGNERSQKLKYHIQTSGRSLHAQEIDFNDIRTTLQALYAIYDNCNSLHTNAYDEAITTPTEESVRRAMAIQLIINRELGTAKNENPNQGSFLIEELTDLVEEAVLKEFDRITERGGVLGAMERMYQRNKIQEESLYYESLKHTGDLPIVGVNTFLGRTGSPTLLPGEVIRSTTEEKEQQIRNLRAFHKRNEDAAPAALKRLQHVAVTGGNLFAELMETVKHCSLGQITHALYEVGGQYRRSM